MSAWEGLGVAAQSVPERLSDKLIERIESGLVEEGAKLPSERELIDLTGASRTSIRQALHDLERRGYVKRLPRVGTVVRRQDRPALDQSLFGDLGHGERVIREVMDLRTVIEPPMAERAARRRSDSELAALEVPLRAAETELSHPHPGVDEVQRCDIAFHAGIARLTHNTLLERLLEVTSDWMAPSRATTLQTARRMRLSVDAHRRVFEAIRAADPGQAAEAMTDHLLDLSRVIHTAAAIPGEHLEGDL